MHHMIMGLSMSAFTTLHVFISLIAIVAGAIGVLGMLNGKDSQFWTGVFLATTILTSITGLMFPSEKTLPSHIVGYISLALLAVAVIAYYIGHLAGAWRWLYAVAAVAAFYLNAFVGVVQSFQKLAFLQPLAPTQSEPPFAVAQGAVLVIFLWLGYLAVRRLKGRGAA
jgi:hypothetical protein